MKISDKFHSEDINRLKNTVLTGKTEDIKWRIQHINKVSKLLDENKKEIIKSLFVDLGKSEIDEKIWKRHQKKEIFTTGKNF